MMSIQTSMATEKDIMSNDVIKQAFDNNVNKISCIPETIETIEVYDSRLDEKEIIKPQSAKASYDYYKTYRTGVTCKGSGAASSYLLNANITFYVNVFFKSTKASSNRCFRCIWSDRIFKTICNGIFMVSK